MEKIAFHHSGEGNPILLLYGNPISSYLWRDVIPSLRGLGKIVEFQRFRSDKGEELILQRNLFIEKVLPGSGVSQAILATGRSMAHADLATPDSDRWRAIRRGRDCV